MRAEFWLEWDYDKREFARGIWLEWDYDKGEFDRGAH